MDASTQQIDDSMRAGALSLDGFLGSDTRTWDAICRQDHDAVLAAGTTHRDIAAALQRILDRVAGAYGTPIDITPTLRATFHESMGRIACPLGCGVYPKGEVELVCVTGQQWRFTPLSVHLISEHGFYQGHGSPYRIEPAEIVEVLGDV
jgi:hypothetical protein